MGDEAAGLKLEAENRQPMIGGREEQSFRTEEKSLLRFGLERSFLSLFQREEAERIR